MTILHIDSSITGEQSASRAISGSIIEQLADHRGEQVRRGLRYGRRRRGATEDFAWLRERL